MIPFPDKKYSIIYADPPWSYDDKADSGKRGAGHKYPTMSIYEIMALPVRQIAEKDALCFLWTTGPMLEEAKQVMKAWGFTFRTVAFVWVKLNKSYGKVMQKVVMREVNEYGGIYDAEWGQRILEDVLREAVFKGMGNYTRSNVEYVYVGSRGKNPERADKSVGQVIFAPRGQHSEKPERVREEIDLIYRDGARIELFARQRVGGWDAWGLEVDERLPIEKGSTDLV